MHGGKHTSRLGKSFSSEESSATHHLPMLLLGDTDGGGLPNYAAFNEQHVLTQALALLLPYALKRRNGETAGNRDGSPGYIREWSETISLGRLVVVAGGVWRRGESC